MTRWICRTPESRRGKRRGHRASDSANASERDTGCRGAGWRRSRNWVVGWDVRPPDFPANLALEHRRMFAGSVALSARISIRPPLAPGHS